ncbi:hypothetical protein D1007_18557 [Hordeum vulgare]|nr:hypothetical protein D1007_18557 [Hordeum vulgare]
MTPFPLAAASSLLFRDSPAATTPSFIASVGAVGDGSRRASEQETGREHANVGEGGRERWRHLAWTSYDPPSMTSVGDVLFFIPSLRCQNQQRQEGQARCSWVA